MIYKSSEIQGKRIKTNSFWNEAPEDVLSEIFIRLPDCRSAVRCSTVSRLWHSSILGNPRFIPEFTSQHHRHRDRYPPVLLYTIFLCKIELHKWPPPEPEDCQPICQIFSEEWTFLHGKRKNYLDFLPSPMVIRAVCNDLLLVSLGGRMSKQHFICSPITKQFFQLPATPSSPGSFELIASGYALLCPSNNNSSRFKVVEFLPPDYPRLPAQPIDELVRITVTVFCSESRKWERKTFHYPRLRECYNSARDIVTCNGVFYWLEDTYLSERVIYLDLLNEQCWAINIPSDDSHEYYRPLRIGVVHDARGGEQELRLIQIDTKRSQAEHGLKVWRLNNGSWVLVHNIRATKLWEYQHYLVHPTNGDLLFTMQAKDVFEFNLVTSTYKKIGELLETVYENTHMPFPMVLFLWSLPTATVLVSTCRRT